MNFIEAHIVFKGLMDRITKVFFKRYQNEKYGLVHHEHYNTLTFSLFKYGQHSCPTYTIETEYIVMLVDVTIDKTFSENIANKLSTYLTNKHFR